MAELNDVKPSSVLIIADYEIAPKDYLNDMVINSDNIYIGSNTDKTASIPLKNGDTLSTKSLTKYLNDLSTGSGVIAEKLGTSTAYVTYAQLSPIVTWYNASNTADSDTVINKWNEISSFISGFTESDDLATFLSNNYVAKSGSTMTGALTVPTLNVTGTATFTTAAIGDLIGNASTATRLSSTTAVGGATLPVYFSGGLPVAGTTYAGGTAITLNGTSKAGTTASFWAPTSLGTANYILATNSAAGGLEWVAKPTSNVTSHLYVGATGATANVLTATSDPYLSLVEGSTLDSQVQLKAGTGITVSANNGVVTITNSSTNTHTYTSYWTSASDDTTRYIGFSPSSVSSGSAYQNYYDTHLYYNPSTNTLTVQNISSTGTSSFDVLNAGNITASGAVVGASFNGYVLGAACAKSYTDSSSASAISTGTSLVTERDVYYGLPTINGSHAYTSSTNYYAVPTSTGTNGQVWSSNGGNSGTWTTLSDYYTTETVTDATGMKFDGTSGNKEKLNSAKWVDSLISVKAKTQGTYAISITDSTTGAVFSGVFSNYYSTSDITNDLDEIPLHMAASATNKARIYIATQNGKLYFSSQDSSDTAHTLIVKIKRII